MQLTCTQKRFDSSLAAILFFTNNDLRCGLTNYINILHGASEIFQR